jgi:hypothetical protein
MSLLIFFPSAARGEPYTRQQKDFNKKPPHLLGQLSVLITYVLFRSSPHFRGCQIVFND